MKNTEVKFAHAAHLKGVRSANLIALLKVKGHHSDLMSDLPKDFDDKTLQQKNAHLRELEGKNSKLS